MLTAVNPPFSIVKSDMLFGLFCAIFLIKISPELTTNVDLITLRVKVNKLIGWVFSCLSAFLRTQFFFLLYHCCF